MITCANAYVVVASDRLIKSYCVLEKGHDGDCKDDHKHRWKTAKQIRKEDHQ